MKKFLFTLFVLVSFMTMNATGVSKTSSAVTAETSTVSTPEFSVERGIYYDPQTVAITCATEGASIEYSTDSATWSTYTEALTIYETTKLYARASKDGSTSAVASATYILESVTTKFECQNDNLNISQGVWTHKKDGITVSCSYGQNWADWYLFLAGDSLTISCPEGGFMTSIEFTCAESDMLDKFELRAGGGKLTSTDTGNIVTWTGSANSVIIRAKYYRIEYTKMVVTYCYGEVASPQFSTDASKIYYDKVDVASATCEMANSTIDYVLIPDGSEKTEPTFDDWKEGMPATLQLTESGTIYARARARGYKVSATSSIHYTVHSTVPVSSILEALNLYSQYKGTDEDGLVVRFKNSVTVVYHKRPYLFVKDETASLVLYGAVGKNDDFYLPGDTFQAGFFGQIKNDSNGWTQLRTDVSDESPASFILASSSGISTSSKTMALSDITADMQNQYVEIRDVTLASTTSGGKTITSGDVTVAVSDVLSTTTPEDGVYGVKGFVVKTADGIAIAPWYYSCSDLVITPSSKYCANGEEVKVSVSCKTEGVTVSCLMATLDKDGNITATSNNTYTVPFDVTVTGTDAVVTMSLWSVTKENTSGNNSAIAYYTFGNGKREKVNDIATAIYGLYVGRIVEFSNPVTVVGQYGDYTFIQDSSGSLVVKGALGQTYKEGDVIPAGFYGLSAKVDGWYQLQTDLGSGVSSADSFSPATETATIADIEEYAIDDITTDLQNQCIQFHGEYYPTLDANHFYDYYGNNKVEFDYTLKEIDFPISPSSPADSYYIKAFVKATNSGGTPVVMPVSVSATAGVEDAVADEDVVKVVAGQGIINVIGEVRNVAVYTIGGALVSVGKTSVEVGSGMYIVKVDGVATKVIVR